MAKTQSINSLMYSIENNEYFLPEFQRGYVWTSEKVKRYFQSLYARYPTGTFLIWKAKNPPKMRGEYQSGEREIRQLILDGQQRLTTLYVFIKGKIPPWFEGRTLRTDLYFNLATEEFQYYSKLLMQGKIEWIPVAEFLQIGLGNYLEQYAGDTKSHLISKYFNKLNNLDKIGEYEYYIQEIEEQDDIKVVEIFNLVNSKGTPLARTDLSLALITSRWEQAKDQMRSASQKYKEIGFNFGMDFFVRCIAVAGTERGILDDIPKLNREDLIRTWGKIEKSVNYLLDVMIRHGYVDSTDFLTSLYGFYPIIYYLTKNNYKFPNARIRDKFLYWFYSALLWGRYSGSSETILDKDIRILKQTNSVDELIKATALLRGGNLKVSPKDLELQGQRSRFYQIVYLLIRSNGATDWVDPSLSLYPRGIGNNVSIRKHYIFPKKELYQFYNSNNSYDKKLVNEIANMTFVASATEHKIPDTEPSQYLVEIPAEQLRQQFIPNNPKLWRMSKTSYEAFLKERRRLLAEGINKFLDRLYSGQIDIHVVSDIKYWEGEITTVEKNLRKLVVDTYHKNKENITWSYIPSAIASEVEKRIKQHLTDRPFEEAKDYQTIDGQIHFFTLYQLYSLISYRKNWPYFQSVFGDKKELELRFKQLTNFRNSLAHNRKLDDIAIKDGEAALLWFTAILSED